ncbi:hypothetical protein CMUS01_10487 [Colletotrichum musicola]|uniref:Uncharacterized protein n=1 Tax=Colletotrichum musicola TaxID=2175873 RepID=A0A8H6K426_9PEZI|nr:hypothetical protein CMUS01_10487 [Colletotrichum musicola]
MRPEDPKKVPPILRMDALRRLYWPVYEDISKVQVFDDPEEDEEDSPKRPFLGHPLANEPVTNYGMTELLMKIGIQEDKEAHTLSNDDYEGPRLLVKREDGGAITFGDFVTQIHPFLQEHKQETMELWEEYLGKVPEDDIIFFRFCDTDHPRCLSSLDEVLTVVIELKQSSWKYDERYYRWKAAVAEQRLKETVQEWKDKMGGGEL